MFKLINLEDNVSIKCEIISYQFPENLDEADCDWCMLKVNIKQDNQCFEKIYPALDAQDLVNIYQWFKALSEYKLPNYAHLYFTEPCISFEYLSYKNNTIRIAIQLSHELKPYFELQQFKSSSNNWDIIFSLNTEDFAIVLNGLEQTIKQFPSRKKVLIE